ncbi:Ni/Fe hydrogenase subunit alpha [Chromobacterium alticapitis]|uniref:Ni/Fe hydrogenase subunit alpha n=1 Tax=Chromobacterium alticapitis TaxID=2073169 RepID=A0A2S5DAM7_9NEIS|nr:Ni/Fe hydrogenase subunit alpha [Chromobacterium alticapitis]POZ60136.1 Ni/Fe hydrogenase subunit alpha [Chromobacterium alticapitis]
MNESLESADHPERLRRVAIEPLSRVEGHGKITLLLDEARRVRQARLHIVEFRGFEKFIQGRPYWEVPTLVQRLCGICPVSHLLAASKAMDAIALGEASPPPAATRLRRLLHFGQVLQSHALHFFHLASPDLLFGSDDAVAHRNFLGVLADERSLAMKGIRLRKYGQELIQALTGKRIHGTGSVPGGFNKPLRAAERDALRAGLPEALAWAQEGLGVAKSLYLAGGERNRTFAAAPSNFLSLVGADGSLELFDGGLRVKDPAGAVVMDHVDVRGYAELLREQVKPWTYMKFPYLAALGPERGWYRVGPLARVNNCDFIATPLAEAARRDFVEHGAGAPVQATLAYHWARMIELLHCVEAIAALLDAPAILDTDLLAQGSGGREGIGVIEAPRGTLFHHYQVGEDDLVSMANLIVSTTSNNQAMNESIRSAAADIFDGREISEAMLNRMETAVRAYDPCLSCATHAMGKMPLRVEAVAADGGLVDCAVRQGDGSFERGLRG